MARYLLTCPHTPEDCVPDIDSILGHSKELLARFDWGCKDGEHIGWVVVEAANETTARMMLPVAIRNKASLRLVNKFTPQDIEQMHAGGA
jgi:hypothetical protein